MPRRASLVNKRLIFGKGVFFSAEVVLLMWWNFPDACPPLRAATSMRSLPSGETSRRTAPFSSVQPLARTISTCGGAFRESRVYAWMFLHLRFPLEGQSCVLRFADYRVLRPGLLQVHQQKNATSDSSSPLASRRFAPRLTSTRQTPQRSWILRGTQLSTVFTDSHFSSLASARSSKCVNRRSMDAKWGAESWVPLKIQDPSGVWRVEVSRGAKRREAGGEEESEVAFFCWWTWSSPGLSTL